MKKHFLLFIALFAASLFVMAEMTIYVYKKDGTKVQYAAAKVDSIGFAYYNPEYVDLGLPSGVLWAKCNLGADSPEDYGDYFAWGETEPKLTYSWTDYKWCNGSYDSQTKYCASSSYGIVDNKSTLDLADDVANVYWGGNWRLPTKAELEELINNCTCTRTTLNGVRGIELISKINGNSIFLPRAGRRSTELNDTPDFGFYSSSSLKVDASYNCFYLYLYYYGTGVTISDGSRSLGYSVRPVLVK